MAENKTPEGTVAATSQDEGTAIPRVTLGENGFVGLQTSNGHIYAESNRAFQFPHFHKTVNEIRHNPTVGAAMNVYRMMISRPTWSVEPASAADEKDKQRAKLIETMMHDMEHSFKSFIEEVVPYLEYGHDVHEKVFRRRLARNGSKYNDGVVGLKKLAPRNQDTIERWVFSEDGADLLAIQQNISQIENSYRFVNKMNEQGLIEIPRNKFLLFTASGNRGNPQGHSIYKAIYLAYKTLQALQEQEMIAVAKDVQGIMKIGVPVEFLAADVSSSHKATVDGFQKMIDTYNAGTNRGFLVPIGKDHAGNDIFTYDLLEQKGAARYDIEAIIKRLQTDILSALNVDILKLGAEGTGSFSLAESKSSVLAIAIDYRLREIQDVLNNDLMPSIYEMNGWSKENMAKFVYEDVEEVSLEEMGKFVQQVFSVGGIEFDRPVANRIRKVFGVAPLPDNEPVDKEKLSTNMASVESNAGEGMKTAGPGTATSPMGKKDASAANANNK